MDKSDLIGTKEGAKITDYHQTYFRNFIGIEKDDKYFEIAKNRIADCISKQLVKSC